MMMPEIVYVCSALISAFCTALLFRRYIDSRGRLLLWVALSFAFMTMNNVFVCVDLILMPEKDLWGSLVRNTFLAASGSVLVFGLTWELS